MQENELIKKYFDASNYIVICQMYLNEYLESCKISKEDLRKYNPGHLGTSLSLNFIQANLSYFLNKNNLTNKLIIGTGHGGVSLITNLWLNGTLYEYYPQYSLNIKGLNNLIQDFGTTIRSEINPKYPETIYDGGELGYSLGVAYGYAINTNEDIVSCIIGDGEAETGTLCSAWQLNKLLKTKSKVLPIINLNELKMGSPTFLSRLSNEELVNYYSLLGYQVTIIDSTKESNLLSVIDFMQNALNQTLRQESPLIIFRSKKGFTLPRVNELEFEGNINVHKNPLQNYSLEDKLDIVRNFLSEYDNTIFDDNDILNIEIQKFKTLKNNSKELIVNKIDVEENETLSNIESLENFLSIFIRNNKLKIFSPDEIFSNKLGKLSSNTIEILNENLLQALYQGYVQAGNNGLYVSYEGFMPIIISMVTQYYKFLKQKQELENCNDTFSMNYILTSTCFENNYSHQNPEFVNSLLQRDDNFYSVLYPKDGANLIKCMEQALYSKNKINVMVTSKRHLKKYQNYNNANINIDTVVDCEKPDLILCATGDYMLDTIINVYERLKGIYQNIKIVYITNPKVLDTHGKNALSETEFYKYFNNGVPVIYLFTGYSHIIKALMYERNVDCNVLGYDDQISVCGHLQNNLESNNISILDIEKICLEKLERGKTRILRK